MQAVPNLTIKPAARPKDRVETSNLATVATLTLFNIYLGHHLGLYQALVLGRPSTAADIATWLDLDERFIRDWLEQQAEAGVLEIENPEAEPAARCYDLPPAQAKLVDEWKNGDSHLNSEYFRSILWPATSASANKQSIVER